MKEKIWRYNEQTGQWELTIKERKLATNAN